MKITGYQQGLTNAGGGSSAKINLGTSAKAAASEAIDLNPVIKGIGDVAKTIDYVHEQEDKANILAAMDSYNQNVNDLMHNETDGLMNTKEQGAAGITDKYLEGTKKIKDTVLGNTRLHFRGNQQALDNFFNKASEQGFEQVRAHQYKQDQIVQDNHLGNIKSAALVKAGDNYNNRVALALGKTALGFAVEFRYSSFGEERVKAEKRKAYGEYGAAAMQNAVANNDIEAQRKIFEDYGEYMTQQQRANYQKLSAKQQESNFEYSVLDAVKGMSTKDALAYIDNLQYETANTLGNTETIAQGMRDLAPKMGYYDPNNRNNTYCAKAITSTPALKGTDYEGVTWVPTLISIAKSDKHKEWHDANEPGFTPGPNDIAVVGDHHVAVIDENGVAVQNGASGNNGAGGIYTDPHGRSPKQIWGDEISGYIRVKNMGQLQQVNKPITRERREQLKKLVLNQVSQEHRIEQDNARNLQDSIRQEIFNNKMSFEDAQKKFVTGKQWSSPKERDAAAAAVALEFGTSKGVANGTKGLRQNKGKGDKMVDYEMQKLIENNAFVNENGLPDRTVLMNYLGSPDCADMTQTQKYKAVTLFDHFTEKTGPYKIKWNEFDDQMLAGTGFKGDAKEYALANCRAAALDYIMNYKPQENLGRQFPTMEEIVQAGRKGMLTNWQVTYYDEEKGFFGGVNKVKKTVSIPEGALRAAGYVDWKDEGEESTLATLKDKSGVTRNVPKKALVEKFKQ